MKNDLIIQKFGSRIIAIGGVGKMYYQDGFPIEMSTIILKDEGIEVSYFHVADELLKNGFPPNRVINILKADGIEGIEDFCFAPYENQREMIFDYLFKDKNDAKNFFIKTITNE